MANAQANEHKSYHWIREEVAKLDPYKDYAMIYRLTNTYGLSDFINNLMYSLTFPNFVVTPQGAQAVWREDGGKVRGKGCQRVEKTENNNTVWWYYGPTHPKTQKSVARINELHQYWEKQYPGNFSHNSDYVYTAAFSAVLMHRFRLRLGLSGISEKEKIANHLFWQEMCKYFKAAGPDGKVNVDLYDFPKDFDGCIKYCEEFENTPKEGTEQGHLIAIGIYEQFAFRYFPPMLRWFGYAMPVALSLPTTLATHKVKPVNPVLKAFIVWLVGMFFWISAFLADPKVSFTEEIEGLSREERTEREKHLASIDKQYAPYFTKKHVNDWAGATCPYHQAMTRGVDGSTAKYGEVPLS
ncbi:uncharacterized protein PAC_14246 [Phialocephala subalpina]|uniref:ER-bound oxygenase mpaB/mpaB'/Rubber oxygenase catalytic domain-containing protein n=1 Tax=Phialocephala subalpina TaxID=576137 RepID=A0A1L7XH54_9HELO|nr:uncharacterized protein PAC_14246 [Phialocephala subalpina]